jgi:predicted ATPase
MRHGFIRSLVLLRDQIASFDKYPFSIPAIRTLEALELDPKVTFFIGENGSGKSTLIEAAAIALGFSAEGGSRNFNFSTRRSESDLHKFIRVVRGTKRPKDGFFLRAESFFNAATYLEEADPALLAAYGGTSLHEQSHGESFMALLGTRFRGNGLYLLDEPEAALSPMRQLVMLKLMHRLLADGSQFIIATHSPILMAYPGALLYELGDDGIRRVNYEETEHYQVTKSFLASPERYLNQLFADE